MFVAFTMYEVKLGTSVGAGTFMLFIAWAISRSSGKIFRNFERT
jgi:hypothetical protein